MYLYIKNEVFRFILKLFQRKNYNYYQQFVMWHTLMRRIPRWERGPP